MCTFSMVIDHYQPLFPNDWPPQEINPITHPITIPSTIIPNTAPFSPNPISLHTPDLQELRKLIAEFKEAIAAAKTVDRLTGQPDCEDPAKAKLEARVEELEKALNKLTRKPKAKKRKLVKKKMGKRK